MVPITRSYTRNIVIRIVTVEVPVKFSGCNITRRILGRGGGAYRKWIYTAVPIGGGGTS